MEQTEKTEQQVFCSNCGTGFKMTLTSLGVIVCSEECLKALVEKVPTIVDYFSNLEKYSNEKE